MVTKRKAEVAELRAWLLQYAARPGLNEQRAVDALGRLGEIGDSDSAFIAAIFVWPHQKPEPSGHSRNTRWVPVNSQYPLVVRAAAARAIRRLVLESSSAGLPELDEAVRRLGRERWVFGDGRGGWIWVVPPKPQDIEVGSDRIALLGLLSGHRDGFVRQRAVEVLADSSAYGALRFLLWRATDWTPQVAAKAATAFERRVSSAPLVEIAALLPLAVRIRKLSRGTSSLADMVDAQLLTPAGIIFLRRAVAGSDRSGGRYAAKLIAASANHTDADISALLTSADEIVRRTALQLEARLRASSPDRAARIRSTLVLDRQPAVRSAALAALVEAESESCADVLKAALTDTAGSVRSLAVFWLSRLAPDFDVAAAYKTVLAGRSGLRTSALAAAAAAVGDIGVQSAWDDLVSLLDDSPSVARAALRSLRKLDPDRALPQILGRLADHRPGVAKDAMAALPRWLSSTVDGDLAYAWAAARDGVARRALADASLRMAPWSSLIWLLSATREHPQDTLDALQRWRSESTGRYAPTAPPAPVRQQLVADLSAVAATLPPKLFERLAAALN